ncbi:MAG: 5-aminolevulic acid synthase [Pseudomonadota bacterium]
MIRSALIALAMALPAAAQTVPDRAAARDMLFDTRGVDLIVTAHSFLSDLDIATLQQMPQVMQLKYYGALAVPPAEGLRSEAARGAFNYHSPDAARRAALTDCDGAKSGGAACVIVADIRPRGWQAGRPLTLNQDATDAVRGRAFRRAGRAAALAVSPSTGQWGLADGPAAAIAECGVEDCVVAVGQ